MARQRIQAHMIAPMAVPLVLAATNNNWTINMGLFALSYFLGAICWAFINSDERLHPSDS